MSTLPDDLSVSEATLDINTRHGGKAVGRYTVWRTISETPGLGCFKRRTEWRVPRTALPRLEHALGLHDASARPAA